MEIHSFYKKLTYGYIALILSVYLIFTGFGGYQEITAQKAVMLYLIAGVYLGGTLLLIPELALVQGRKPPTPAAWFKSLHLMQILALLFWISLIISTIFSVNTERSIFGGPRKDGLITYTIYCWTFILIGSQADAKKWMLWLLGTAATVNCVISILQFGGFNPLWLYPEGMTYYDANKLYSGEFLGTLGNVDIMSAFMSLVIPVFWVLILKLKGKMRFLLLIPLILSGAVLLRAFVAGGVLGILAGFLVTVPVITKNRKARRILWIVCIAIVIAGLLVVYFAGGYMEGMVYEASEIMHGNWDDDFGTGRVYIWKNVVKLVPERLFFGGGPDTLGLRTDASFERYDEDLDILIHSDIDVAHNEYLNILVNDGLIALLLYLGILVFGLVEWIRRGPADPVMGALGAGLAAYSVQAFFGIGSLIVVPVFWILLGLMVYRIKTYPAAGD